MVISSSLCNSLPGRVNHPIWKSGDQLEIWRTNNPNHKQQKRKTKKHFFNKNDHMDYCFQSNQRKTQNGFYCFYRFKPIQETNQTGEKWWNYMHLVWKLKRKHKILTTCFWDFEKCVCSHSPKSMLSIVIIRYPLLGV